MGKQIGITITFVLLFLFVSTAAIADTGSSSTSTTTNTTNNSPGDEPNINDNSTTKTTFTNSSTITTVDNGDARIVDGIYKQYAKESALDGTSLTVTCVNGVVTISGTVTMTSQAEQAVSVAKSIEGVKEVTSTINVKTNQTGNHQPKASNY